MVQKGKRNVLKLKNISVWIHDYRFDIFALVVMLSFIAYFMEVLLRPGQIVFSDLDFPFNSETYLDEIFGIWNTKWNTTAMLNIPRLIVLLPSFLFSRLFNNNGDLFLKIFILQNLSIAGMSFYLFCKRLINIYINANFTMSRIFLIIFGSLYYALNPWVVFRIQHIYLLVGYSFFPLILLLFLKVFDYRFQEVAIKGYDCYTPILYKENKRDIVLLAFVITVSSAAIHYFFYTVILLSVLIGLLILKYIIKYRQVEKQFKKGLWVNFIKKIISFGFVLFGFSFYWLFIYVGSIIFRVQASQNNINVVDTYVAFSRNSALQNVLYLISYWWPMIDMSKLPISFYIGGAIILAVSALGMMYQIHKRHIILFMSLLSLFILIFSTGVRYPYMAKIFLKVTELPIVGSIFRDPNKLVGLLALFLATFFVFGLESVVEILSRLYVRSYMLIPLFIAFISVAVLAYLLPMKTQYVEHFYAPIEKPESYVEFQKYYEGDTNHYGIYLPLSDEMTQEYSHVSTPFWNEAYKSTQSETKATGDIQVYNSPIPTLFQFEGNDPIISYYYQYLQFLLDQGRSNRIGILTQAFGNDQLIYHNEYKQQFDRQSFNSHIIELDKTLIKSYSNTIFSVYDMPYSLEERDNSKSMVNQLIMTPYGFERTPLYDVMGIYDPLKNPVIYLNQRPSNTRQIEDIQFNHSVVEAKNNKDLTLSLISEEYALYPFNWTNQGNVFLGWSKTFLSSVDWKWFLQSQDMINRNFDFDKGQGVAVTFASNRLALEPYLRDTTKGKLILDFDALLRTENFFVPDNPDLFEISSNPYSELKQVQTLYGELVKDESKDIWQVAKSGILEANGGTPYLFELVLSGRDVDKLHLKVRFYNAQNQEIGVSYVVAANETSYFDSIKFLGQVISPSQTTHMRIDLLTFQNPEYKSYWWIHDVNIYDLSEYVEENTLSSSYDAQVTGLYDVFMRSFNSTKGGGLDLVIDNTPFTLDTKTDQKNTFEWSLLGQLNLEKGVHSVDLTALDGFNAVGSIVIIPHETYLGYEKRVAEQLTDSPIIMSFESSIDLNHSGNIQSDRIYPNTSMGKAIALAKGELKGEFDILNSDTYTIYPTILFVNDLDGYATLKLINQGEVIQTWDMSQRQSTDESVPIVEYYSKSKTHPYSLMKMDVPYKFEGNQAYDIQLEPGHYSFEIDVDSQTRNKTSLEQLNPFDFGSVKFPIEDTLLSEEGSCERITEDMMQKIIYENGADLIFDPTCSTDWYSYSTNKIAVKKDEEYLVRFDARSENLKKRHLKVLFMDEQSFRISEVFINEVEEQYKSDWNHYEQLIKVPEGATQMLLQTLGRGDREKISTLEINNLEIFNYNEFMAVDQVFIVNAKMQHMLTEDTLQKDTFDNLVVKRDLSQFGLKYEISAIPLNNTILNTFISPNKNWRYNKGTSDYVLNGITQGFVLQEERIFSLGLLLMPGYIIGLALHLITWLLVLFWVFYTKKR